MHFPNAFIQYVAFNVYIFYQFMHFLRIGAMTLVLLAPRFTVWATEMWMHSNSKYCICLQFDYDRLPAAVLIIFSYWMCLCTCEHTHQADWNISLTMFCRAKKDLSEEKLTNVYRFGVDYAIVEIFCEDTVCLI